MKYLIIIAVGVLLASCGSSTKSTNHIEDLSKTYIKDSLLQKFNDPKSYELASMKIDSVKASSILKNQIDMAEMDKNQKQIDSLKSIHITNDSVVNVMVEVAYRGKNKMGAMVLNNMTLKYLPKEDRVTLWSMD